MKRVFCSKCDNQLSFDETKYPEGRVLAFVCPQRGAQFKIELGRKVVKTATGEEEKARESDLSCGYITTTKNGSTFRRDLPLVMGDNVIGRRNKDAEDVDVPIITSDPGVGRKYRVTNVKKGTNSKFVYMVRDSPSLTGTFAKDVLVGRKEQVRIGKGTIVAINATAFILHSANKEKEEE